MDYSDLIGKRFGKLTVLSFAGFVPEGHGGRHRSAYYCRCDCGNLCVVKRHVLLNGRQTTCCNCFRIEREEDYIRYYCADENSFIFDSQDLSVVKEHKWYINPYGYPCTQIGRKNMPLSRLLMNPEKGQYVDHIDGDPTNNRRQNLRLATPLENQRNMSIAKNNTSGFKGVSYRKDRGKYRAYISLYDRYVHLGHYDTAVEAARAYDQAARFYFGDFACLNFPYEHEQDCNRKVRLSA